MLTSGEIKRSYQGDLVAARHVADAAAYCERSRQYHHHHGNATLEARYAAAYKLLDNALSLVDPVRWAG